MNKQSCPVVLLRDDPAESDAFGSHRRVAKAIAELLHTEEQGGRAIALEGPWGSGKSTTVHLLQDALSEDSGDTATALFVFDAWVHHGDPLKRAFLEELLGFFLHEHAWVSEKSTDDKGRTWSERLENLSKSREESSTSEVPQLGDSALIILLVLTLLPAAWLLITTGMGLPGGWGIASRVLGFGAFAWFIRKVYQTYKSADDLENWRDIVRIVVNQAARETLSVTLRTPEPTSIEFRSFFNDLVGEALGDKGARRLVVVVDNLDRVEAEQALTIWATMRNFFDFGEAERPAWLDHFWLIVPFDRDYLEGFWGREMEPPSAEAKEGKEHLGTRMRKAGGAFLDKTFQVRFRVPSPVTTDRRKFFESQFKAAFPAHEDDNERYAVYRIFDRIFVEEGRLPTPRDIIVFLNEVGALHRQWPDSDVPLRVEALFVALRNRGALAREAQIRDCDEVTPQVEKLLGTRDWQKYLAALYFNIPPEHALQVLLTRPIENALANGDGAALAKLADNVGFGELAPRILADLIEDWLTKEPVALPRAASALAELPEETSHSLSERLWGQLIEALDEVDALEVAEVEDGGGLAALVSRASKQGRKDLAKKVAAALSEGFPAPAEDEEGRGTPDAKRVVGWVLGAWTFVQGVEPALDPSNALTIVIPGSAEMFLNVQAALAQTGAARSVRSLFRPDCAEGEVRSALVDDIRSGQLTKPMADAAAILPDIFDGWAWQNVPATLTQRLATSGITSSELAGLSLLLEKAYRDGAIQDQAMETTLRSQQFFASVWNCSRQEDEEAVAPSLLLEYLHNPDAQMPGGGGDSGSGQSLFRSMRDEPSKHPAVVDKLAELLAELGLCDTALGDAKLKEHAPKLTWELTDRIIRREAPRPCVSPEVLLENVVYVAEDLTEGEFAEILSAYPGTDRLLELASNQPIDAETAWTHMYLYRAVPERAEASGYTEYLVGQLNGSVMPWPDQLAKNGPLIRLLASLVSNGASPELGLEFRKALQNHIEELLVGRKKRDDVSTSPLLVEALEEAAKKVLVNNILENMCVPQAVKQWSGALELCGDALVAEHEDLAAIADRIVRVILCEIVESREPEAYDWAYRVADQVPNIFKKAKKESVKALRDELDHAIGVTEEGDEEVEGIETLKAMRDLVKSGS